MKLNKLNSVLLGLIIFIVDQATKYFAFKGNFGSFLFYLRPVFSKLLFRNYNFAFSLNFYHPAVYFFYSLLLLSLCIWFYRQHNKSNLMIFGVTCILAGALSNIYDRISLGYVRDFIFVFWGNIFNLADLSIVIGILMLLFEPKKKVGV